MLPVHLKMGRKFSKNTKNSRHFLRQLKQALDGTLVYGIVDGK
jgi:hypothetical protein